MFALNSQAQLSGRTTLFDKGCWSMISVNEKVPYITTDGDGNFSIDLPQKLNKVFFLESWISIEIINIPKSVKANLGNLETPMRKSVPSSEYEKSTNEEKKMIIPVHCYTQLVGYEYLDKLENPKIIFTCNNIEYELDKFVFDVKAQKVIIDWKNLKPCAN
jgi:hypothetical protein